MKSDTDKPNGPLVVADGSKRNTLKLRPRAPSTTAYVSTASASGSASASSPNPILHLNHPGSPNGHRSRNFSRPAPPTTMNADGINVEEESRLYDELCRTYEDENDEFSRTNTPVYHGSRPTGQSHPSKLSKSSAPPPPHSLPPDSIFSADIFLADNTGTSSSSHVSQPFAQDVRISGWTTVGDGAGKPGKGVGPYVAYDCVIVTREGTTMHILKRYTAFEELHEKLRRTLPQTLLPFLPSLPPKAPLARFRPAFVDGRRKLLQFCLLVKGHFYPTSSQPWSSSLLSQN
ncbi:hypothetical protein BDZ97DRAFT_1815770 [Flammula alnicola]|nr:hypothetical protein BDZ97DRAFT_1815770 [Flammula alnicola]